MTKTRLRIAGILTSGALLASMGTAELVTATGALAQPIGGGCTLTTGSNYASVLCKQNDQIVVTLTCVHAGAYYYVGASGYGEATGYCHTGDLLANASYHLGSIG